jgi:hypothetical protein
METHAQDLPKTFGEGAWQQNIYAYLRSKDGQGHECNIITVPINKKPSIVNLLTFVELMHLRKPNWQSLDLMVLFYHETDYSLSVREFLDGYFAQ